MRLLKLILALCLLKNAWGSYIIDADDILSNDLMPSSLLVLENPQKHVREFVNVTEKQDSTTDSLGGSVDNALATMGYHRYLINP